jgi:hypothetical protein
MKVLGKGKDVGTPSILALSGVGAERALSLESVLFDQAVDHQQYHRAHQRTDEPRALTRMVNAQGLAAVKWPPVNRRYRAGWS